MMDARMPETVGVVDHVPVEQIEDTIAIDAAPELVYHHVTSVEGLDITDVVTSGWRGGRAMLVIAPDAADGATLTMMADSPEGAEAGVEMRVRMRRELERIAVTIERGEREIGQGDHADPAQEASDALVEIGLDAIEDDQIGGMREAPFADDPSHRP